MSELLTKLITTTGGRFSSQLGIDLSEGNSDQVFKWFLASILFGARISSPIAVKTYREFERKNVMAPEKLLETGWDGLVTILDDGGYVRYDFSTATKLLAVMEALIRNYDGDLNKLHQIAKNEEDLENRLMGLGKGIGDVTVNIFLRELRTVWTISNPEPSPMVKLAAERLGFITQGEDALQALENIWSAEGVSEKDFCDFEAALLRLGKDYCKKSRHTHCPLKSECKYEKSVH